MSMVTISLRSIASCVSNVVNCLPGGDGRELDGCVGLIFFGVLLDDLVGGGGGSHASLRPSLRLNPLRLLGRGGSPCNEDIAILSRILLKKKKTFFSVLFDTLMTGEIFFPLNF